MSKNRRYGAFTGFFMLMAFAAAYSAAAGIMAAKEPAQIDGAIYKFAGALVLWSFAGVNFMLWVKAAWFSQFTPGQLETERLRKKARKAEIQRLKQVKRVAKELRPQIIQALGRAGISYVYERTGATVKSSMPIIRECLYDQDAVYFRVNRLPFRVNFTDMMQPEVARNLGIAIGRECQIEADTELGLWIIVGLKSGLAAIPKWFPWYSKETDKNALELLPKTKPWAIPLGMTQNRQFVYEDLRDFPHLLVAGATDGGKSVYLNQAICSLLKRHTPRTLKLLLIDLKGGVEFFPFHELPHLWRPVIYNPKMVTPALDKVIALKDVRLEKLRSRQVRNIKAWNQTAAANEKWFYLVVMFDEVATLMLDPETKESTERLANHLAEQGRAVGIHVIFCTQFPSRDVITSRIKANAVSRVVFATDENGSMVTLGNHKAGKLPPKTGRMIYRRGSMQLEVQAPFISDSQILDVIKEVTQKEPEEETAVSAHDLFMFSICNLQGKFTRRALLEQLDVSEPFVRETARIWEYNFTSQGPVIDLEEDGRYILVKSSMRGGRGRSLVPVNGQLPQNKEELMMILEAGNGSHESGESSFWEEEE